MAGGGGGVCGQGGDAVTVDAGGVVELARWRAWSDPGRSLLRVTGVNSVACLDGRSLLGNDVDRDRVHPRHHAFTLLS